MTAPYNLGTIMTALRQAKTIKETVARGVLPEHEQVAEQKLMLLREFLENAPQDLYDAAKERLGWSNK